MKKSLFFLSVLVAGSALTSCSKNEIESINEEGSVQATFSGSISEMTRVSGTSWDANDAIGIFMLQNGTTNLTSGVSNVQYVTTGDGTFTANDAESTIYYPVNKSKVDFVAYYPYATLSGTASDPTYVISNWNGVSQDKLDLLVAKSTAHSATNPDVAFGFSHQFSRLELNLSANTETGLTDADLTGIKVCITGINRPATYHLIDQTVSYGTALDEDVFMYVAANGLSANAILPSVKGESIVFTLANGDSFTWDISSVAFESGKCYTYSIALKANPMTVEASLTSVINDWNKVSGGLISLDQDAATTISVSGKSNGHDYVDLGLPSGLLWATKNVGATLITDYGSYFAWGETKAYGEEDTSNAMNYSYNSSSSYVKTYYDWSTYKYCNGSLSTMTKYCYDSSYGTVDNITLELADDAAAVNWGGDWRMPTFDEWSELQSYCTWSWVSMNGVNGYKVESKTNDNSLFLPAAGYRFNASLNDVGPNGIYWSSSLSESYPEYARSLYFNPGGVYTNYHYFRYIGPSVRAVRVAE